MLLLAGPAQWRRPRNPSKLLRIPVRLVLFLCAWCYGTTVFTAWQFGADSCMFAGGGHGMWNLWYVVGAGVGGGCCACLCRAPLAGRAHCHAPCRPRACTDARPRCRLDRWWPGLVVFSVLLVWCTLVTVPLFSLAVHTPSLMRVSSAARWGRCPCLHVPACMQLAAPFGPLAQRHPLPTGSALLQAQMVSAKWAEAWRELQQATERSGSDASAGALGRDGSQAELRAALAHFEALVAQAKAELEAEGSRKRGSGQLARLDTAPL